MEAYRRWLQLLKRIASPLLPSPDVAASSVGSSFPCSNIRIDTRRAAYSLFSKSATSEALAMGKFVVCAEHPSNKFFPVVLLLLTSKSSDEFVTKVKEVMAREAQLLTPEQSSLHNELVLKIR